MPVIQAGASVTCDSMFNYLGTAWSVTFQDAQGDYVATETYSAAPAIPPAPVSGKVG